MKILLSFYEVPKKKKYKFPKITDAQKNPCWFTCRFFVRMFSDNANSFEDSLKSLKAKTQIIQKGYYDIYSREHVMIQSDSLIAVPTPSINSNIVTDIVMPVSALEI